ncbi:MAG: protein translocase subunit SecD [Candidatus Paceibacterota bacterium]|jgi:protein-export membrane protein SecD
MLKHRIWAVILLVTAVLIGYFVYSSQVKSDSNFPFKLGLDLSGGTHLVYEADVSSLAASDVDSSMNTLRDVIERRVNVFGVSEPIVQVENGNVFGSIKSRLIVELPGVTNVNDAVAAIGQTPILEFRLVAAGVKNLNEVKDKPMDQVFIPTGLTGRLLEHSQLEFDQQTGEGIVVLSFNKEGGDLFEKITKENVGRSLAIFLDGDLKSTPVIREVIAGGKATISGGFTGQTGLTEARDLVRNLNLGALPVPIKLVSTQTIGATLGEAAVDASVKAGILAFIIVALFLIIWYRLPGLIAVISLAVYVALNLAIFKLIPVTLTAAGIAGFILSIGMAVDANILIFERMKEELKRGRVLSDAVYEGFARAWLSIRDSNLSSIITAVILYSFASTALVKGFALVFFIGVIVSMFTAITVSRTLLLSIMPKVGGKISHFLFGNGLN